MTEAQREQLVAECERRQTILMEASEKIHAELGCTEWRTNKKHLRIREKNSKKISAAVQPFAFTSIEVRKEMGF